MSRTAAALASVFLFVPFAAAQSRPPILRVETDLQPVDVQVQDAKGNDILGLSANDFTVLENGKPQKIAFFEASNSPVTITILVDSSNSMDSNSPFGSVSAIAAKFLGTARPGDEVSGMEFSDQMGPFQQLTPEQLRNPSAITLAPAPGQGSALYDAIATALCHLRTSKNLRKAIIVISNGDDQYSRLSLDQLIGLVRSSSAQIFMIGLQSLPEFGFQGHSEPKLTLITGHDIDNPIVVFADLMKESGTESFIAKSRNGLDEALKAVSNMLQSEYTLAYYPHDTANELRKIEVKVHRHGARVLPRQFIESEADASLVHFDEPTCTVSPKFHPYPYEAVVMRGASGIIYREDFSDHHTGWPNHPNSHYVSGGYELSNVPVPVQVPNGNPWLFDKNVIAAYGPWWTNFRASVTVRIVPALQSKDALSQFPYATLPAAGLVFRMSLEGYYALLLSGNSKKRQLSVELVRRDFLPGEQRDYAETQIVPWTTAGAFLGAAAHANLSVEETGNQISVIADGREIKTVSDPTYDQGFVGLIVSGPAQATFKNLVVEEK